MQMLINFVKEYWFLILPGIEIICTILVLVLRKNPIKVVDTLKEVIIRLLPALICQAEKTDLKGSDKLKYVLTKLAEILKELNYGDDVVAQYLPFASEQVEVILSTPQKKGVK